MGEVCSGEVLATRSTQLFLTTVGTRYSCHDKSLEDYSYLGAFPLVIMLLPIRTIAENGREHWPRRGRGSTKRIKQQTPSGGGKTPCVPRAKKVIEAKALVLVKGDLSRHFWNVVDSEALGPK